MPSMELSQVLATMVETMLPRFSNNRIGLYMVLDLREDCYTEDGTNEKSAASIMRFIIHRPSNYTKVLTKYEFNNFHEELGNNGKDTHYYEKQSDHDSCWRSDGFNILFKHRQNVEKFFAEQTSEVNEFYTFSMFDSPGLIMFNKFEPVKQDDGYVRGYNISFERANIHTICQNESGGIGIRKSPTGL